MTAKATELLAELGDGPMTLGRVIRSIRLAEQTKPAPFSRAMGVSVPYLNDLERDLKIVKPGKAYEWAELLNYPPQEFVRLALQDELRREGIEFEVRLD